MKIDPNLIKTTPKNMEFNFCVFGEPMQEIQDWISFWNLKTQKSGNYTNILLGNNNVYDLFLDPKTYDYIDGFSPNLNKHLHLGHISNLILAKSFQKLKIGNKFIAILGDALEGSIQKDEALKKFKEYCQKFDYKINDLFFASEQVLKNQNLLEDGEGDYIGTKVFDVNGEKIVGVKSTGKTTYFYQDISLAEKLNGSILYMTGFEQDNHFNLLKKLYPETNHIGLGLVAIDNKKMSSSEGNVIFADEVFELIKSKFDYNEKLAWNILAGVILNYEPKSVKNINTKSLYNVKSSYGLYLSYTLARMKSAGMKPNKTEKFNSQALKFKLLKSKFNLSPNLLLSELVDHCKKISQLYIDNHIKDNIENQKMFQPLVDDLCLGMELLGMFDIDKV